MRATQAQFGPIRIADGFWIVPSWCAAAGPGARSTSRSIPGSRSAPGSHPTTRLCLEWLRAQLARAANRVLDYGCGSGILAIAAARLGAGRVVGADVDPQAIARQRATMRARNGVDATFVAPDALRARAAVRRRRRQHPRQSADRCSRRRSPRACAPAGASCCPAFSTRRPTRSPRRTRAWFNIARLRRRRGRLGRAGGRAARRRIATVRCAARRARRDPSQPAMAEEQYTRCPGCTTIFRVTPQQLALRDGQVRCGHCQTVFDGARKLISLAPPREPRRRTTAYDEAGAGPADGHAAQRAALDPPPPAEPRRRTPTPTRTRRQSTTRTASRGTRHEAAPARATRALRGRDPAARRCCSSRRRSSISATRSPRTGPRRKPALARAVRARRLHDPAAARRRDALLSIDASGPAGRSGARAC